MRLPVTTSQITINLFKAVSILKEGRIINSDGFGLFL